MTEVSAQSAGEFASRILDELRRFVKSEKLSMERLPRWVRSASVRLGILNDSVLILIEDSYSGDKFDYSLDSAKSDTQFLLQTPEFVPKGFILKAPHTLNRAPIIFQGGDGSPPVLRMLSANTALFEVGYCGNHTPVVIINMFVLLAPNGDPLVIRFVPFALFVHRNDLNFDKFWKEGGPFLQDSLRVLHSEAGEFYRFQMEREMAFRVTKEKSVVVLGKYGRDETVELENIRDYLKVKGYDAHLLIDLPEIPMMSVEEKARLWSGASRFCVMLDRTPGGHIAEYQWLKNQRTILALLRPKGTSSTGMMGDEPLVDYRFIKLFEFENSPLAILDSAISWAEGVVTEREQKYDATYTWRNK